MKPVADLTTDELLAIALQHGQHGQHVRVAQRATEHRPCARRDLGRHEVGRRHRPEPGSNLTTNDAVYVGWLTEPEFDASEDFEDLVKRYPDKFTRLNPPRGSN